MNSSDRKNQSNVNNNDQRHTITLTGMSCLTRGKGKAREEDRAGAEEEEDERHDDLDRRTKGTRHEK